MLLKPGHMLHIHFCYLDNALIITQELSRLQNAGLCMIQSLSRIHQSIKADYTRESFSDVHTPICMLVVYTTMSLT